MDEGPVSFMSKPSPVYLADCALSWLSRFFDLFSTGMKCCRWDIWEPESRQKCLRMVPPIRMGKRDI